MESEAEHDPAMAIYLRGNVCAVEESHRPAIGLELEATSGLHETRDMIDFCARSDIRPEIEKIPMTGIDDAWARVVEKKARHRYVSDLKG